MHFKRAYSRTFDNVDRSETNRMFSGNTIGSNPKYNREQTPIMLILLAARVS